MLHKARIYIKLLTGFLSLWGLFFLFTSTHKSIAKIDENTSQDKKDKIIAHPQQNIDENSFLFVDCTGFFE